jgi:hypothetical protein
VIERCTVQGSRHRGKGELPVVNEEQVSRLNTEKSSSDRINRIVQDFSLSGLKLANFTNYPF